MTVIRQSKYARLAILAAVAVAALAGLLLLRDPMRDAFAAVGDLRAWIIGLGPFAPLGYFLFYVAQIVIAPLPGSFLSVFGGYFFGFGWGMLLSLTALATGVTIAVILARRFGRGLLARIIPNHELVQWERKLRLRSPIPWFVLFLFPVPDAAVYVAGLSSLKMPVLLAAILIGRGTNVAMGIAMGNASHILPAEIVVVKWMGLFLVGAIALRYQRQLRFWLLTTGRRMRRSLRGTSAAVAATAD
jgi:uncharacterized membrane protein YdjX (TVP38/TMEM64 family)